MDLDFNDELATLEMLLRELVLMELRQPKDDEWISKYSIPAPLVDRWRKYREKESKTSTVGAVGPSLLHCASFMELYDVISHRWDVFETVQDQPPSGIQASLQSHPAQAIPSSSPGAERSPEASNLKAIPPRREVSPMCG